MSDKWIDLHEKQPESFEEVLVYNLNGGIYEAYSTGKEDVCGVLKWGSSSGEVMEGEIFTHWMPLPAPPEMTNKGVNYEKH